MNSRFMWTTAIVIALVGSVVAKTIADEPATAAAGQPNKGIQLSGPSQQQQEQDQRFEFSPHTFGVNGAEQEIYVKLDTYTGKTWRFHASTMRWDSIPEPANSKHQMQAGDESRYELHTHDYYDTNGEEQELILRVDLVNGYAWTYRGANGAWKDVAQDEDKPEPPKK